MQYDVCIQDKVERGLGSQLREKEGGVKDAESYAFGAPRPPAGHGRPPTKLEVLRVEDGLQEGEERGRQLEVRQPFCKRSQCRSRSQTMLVVAEFAVAELVFLFRFLQLILLVVAEFLLLLMPKLSQTLSCKGGWIPGEYLL